MGDFDLTPYLVTEFMTSFWNERLSPDAIYFF